MGTLLGASSPSTQPLVPWTLPKKPVLRPVNNDLDIPYLDLQTGFIMSDALNRTFQELKSKNDDARVKAAHDVYAAVVVAARGE